MHTYIGTYIHTCKHAYIRTPTHKHACIHVYVHIHVYAYMHTCTCVYICTYTYIDNHTYDKRDIHTYKKTVHVAMFVLDTGTHLYTSINIHNHSCIPDLHAKLMNPSSHAVLRDPVLTIHTVVPPSPHSQTKQTNEHCLDHAWSEVVSVPVALRGVVAVQIEGGEPGFAQASRHRQREQVRI